MRDDDDCRHISECRACWGGDGDGLSARRTVGLAGTVCLLGKWNDLGADLGRLDGDDTEVCGAAWKAIA